MAQGRYYLGRLIKGHFLTEERLRSALGNATTIVERKYSWTITEYQEFREDGKLKFIFGHLSKFDPKGEAPVVDDAKKKEMVVDEPNLLNASSPFVYIPAYSGIAYLQVWNKIQSDVFISRFTRIIRESQETAFVDCSINPVTDMKTFLSKLRTLKSINYMSATVNPPILTPVKDKGALRE